MEITLVANAGILIETHDLKILVDGLHQQQDGMFSPVPPKIGQLIENNRGAFCGVNLLLFSHFHEDHYNQEMVINFLKKQCPEKLVIPEGLLERDIEELRKAKQEQCGLEVVEETEGVCRLLGQYGDVRIFAFAVPHAGKEYQHLKNLCFAFFTESEKLLVLSDAEYDPKLLGRMAGGIVFDAVVLNPLFLHLAQGREVLERAVHAKKIIFYHLPFEEDDGIGFRRMIREDVARYQNVLPETEILMEPMQKISI